MKLWKKSSKSPAQSTILGLSEDEHNYCLVQKDAENICVFWQKKPYELANLLQKITDDYTKPFRLIRPISHEYIWRKTVFLPQTLNDIQLHQQIVHILKTEQPLAIELLNFDYQIFPASNSNLNKVIIYALRQSYANSLSQFPCILDCELHCYMRAISYFQSQSNTESPPCVYFKQKIVQFGEAELRFLQEESEHCIRLEDINIPNIQFDNNNSKHLYLLALGATLWNGKVLI